LLVSGGPHNPWFPLKESASNDWMRDSNIQGNIDLKALEESVHSRSCLTNPWTQDSSNSPHMMVYGQWMHYVTSSVHYVNWL
jgi:hypothetical protein